MTPLERARQVGNLVNLSTPLGLIVARVGRARIDPGPRGLLLATHYRPAFPYAAAFTVGNVVLTRRASLDDDLLRHEEGHTWQWLGCLGLPFLPAYAIATGWSVLRTGDRASGNVFERHAGLHIGGYTERPVVPLPERVRQAADWLQGSLGSPRRR